MAFSLAEVLVALTVIGVIAAIVLPQLTYNITENNYKEKWRKTFAVFSVALPKVAFENGGTLPMQGDPEMCACANAQGCCGTGKYFNKLDDYIAFSVVNNLQNCDANNAYMGNNCFQGPSKLQDSGLVYFNPVGPPGYMVFDVNGTNLPNIMGIDTFRAEYTIDGRLLPSGAPGTSHANFVCDPKSTNYNNRAACSAEFLRK